MEPIEYQGNIERFLCEKATINHTPINAILELTPLCNMNCEMCFVRLSPEEMRQQGQIRSVEEWIALGREMREAGTLFVLLTGGEPLLYPGFKEVYQALKNMGMILTVNTNGTLINEEWAEFFAKYPPRRINVTLYGKDRHTYGKLCHYPDGFEKTVKAIKLLQERKIDVKINSSITPDNVEDIKELFTVVEKLNSVWKFDTYMYPASRERSHSFDSVSRLTPEQAAFARVELMRKRAGENFCNMAADFIRQGNCDPGENVPVPIKCRAGRSSFTVSWQGKMRPCVMMSFPEESVFDIGFQDSWQKIVRKVSEIRLNAKCNVCTMRDVCQTCAACALLESGSFDGVPEYMCRYTEETLRLLKEYMHENQ